MSVQTQTRTMARPRTHETQPTLELSDTWDNTVNYFTSILSDTDFLSYCSQHDIDPSDQHTPIFADGLARYIGDLCEVHRADGTMDDTLASRLLILGEFPRYLHQETALATYKGMKYRNMTDAQRQRKESLLHGVIEYDQLMSEHLYANPDESIIEIGAMTASATGLITPGELSQTAKRHIVALKGARVEAVSRHALDALVEMAPGMFSYRPATTKEDAQGADAITTFNGMLLNVDFKASLDGVESEKDGTFQGHTAGKDYVIKSYRRGNETYISVRIAPDFSDTDLGDRCQLSPELLTRVKLHMMNQLMAAYGEVYPNQ